MGKQATRTRTLDNMGKEQNKNRPKMLKLRKNNEMKTFNDRVKKPGPEWTS